MAPPPGGQGTPVAAAVIVPERAPPRRKSFSWARLLVALLAVAAVVFLVIVVVLLTTDLGTLLSASLGLDAAADGRVQEKFFSGRKNASDKVAILTIEGMILNGEGFFKRQVDRAMRDAKDGHLKAVVVRVNSPGGTISGSDYMYHHLSKLRSETEIPVVVSMGAIAASGGYYVSMAVGDTPGTLYAEPTTWTGSIGVIIPHYDLSELLQEHWGVREDSIASHRLKGMGSFARAMTDEEREIFQALVNDGFDRFKNVVQSGRPRFQQDPEALEKLATGQVFTAQQAKQNGLVDEIGFIEDAVDRAIELAGLEKKDVKVVKYKPEPNLMEILLSGSARSKPAPDLAALLDLTTPRAYYLYTWLPPLAENAKP